MRSCQSTQIAKYSIEGTWPDLINQQTFQRKTKYHNGIAGKIMPLSSPGMEIHSHE